MLTREVKQQLDMHISDYKDELGNEDFVYENVRMTPARRAVRAVERWVDRIRRRFTSYDRPRYSA
ncbi:MAG: hypothetical protein JSS76_09040 [Bacteroidetes bacterium]|nr:hypothetical protein [Bacteroidota bacterium]MBS1684887.1 hypothetical protein [Bacteroidota bacterium]